MVKAQPDRYKTVTPYLVIPDAAKCVDFLAQVFGAREDGGRMPAPGGRIGHTELRIGDSIVMLADATEQYPARPAMLHIYVDDVDATWKKGVAAGARSTREPANQFYGDRMAAFEAFGVLWSVATHVEDVTPEEMMRRAQQAHPA